NVQGGSVITGGYDRRHRGILRAVAGLPYDISLGLLSTLESGFLYPNAIGADPRDRELETAPANFQVDLRLEKRFMLTNRFGADFYVDVTNLFDRDNVIAYDTDAVGADVVFQETGVPGSRLILTDGSPLYGPSRTIYFGSRIRF
ncbi:MAG: TonB-dependent receptor, partial [Acidimicrobiia bacterium]|nr:TonB-dependent receptor [Acidimicrobiia bacterium]